MPRSFTKASPEEPSVRKLNSVRRAAVCRAADYAHISDELRQHAASAARERLGEEAWTVARDEGRAMSFEEAVEYALEADEALPT